jgi:hypothetical protein
MTLIDQALDAFVAIVSTTPEATGGVFEDRAQALTDDQDKAIEVTLREADSHPLSDYNPLRSVLATTLQIELAVYTRAPINSAGVETPTRKLSSPLWASAHARLMADPTLGGLVASTRWRRASWRRESANGTAGWAVHTYEITLAMREQNLLAPL